MHDLKTHDLKTDSAVFSGFGLALLGTTCCALPIALVTLGMGGVVASMVSTLPWLAALSKYKAITFSLTAVVLAYSVWRLRRMGRTGQCDIADRQRLRWQRRLLGLSATLFVIAVFAAYALLPIMRWLDS